jgi:hypothetical protein|tara:strand:+ start:8692 stop:8880 length:189 start_codon:yes stop_codon:yes gene_type:complete
MIYPPDETTINSIFISSLIVEELGIIESLKTARTVEEGMSNSVRIEEIVVGVSDSKNRLSFW